jgi:hypothetical protein
VCSAEGLDEDAAAPEAVFETAAVASPLTAGGATEECVEEALTAADAAGPPSAACGPLRGGLPGGRLTLTAGAAEIAAEPAGVFVAGEADTPIEADRDSALEWVVDAAPKLEDSEDADGDALLGNRCRVGDTVAGGGDGRAGIGVAAALLFAPSNAGELGDRTEVAAASFIAAEF